MQDEKIKTIMFLRLNFLSIVNLSVPSPKVISININKSLMVVTPAYSTYIMNYILWINAQGLRK